MFPVVSVAGAAEQNVRLLIYEIGGRAMGKKIIGGVLSAVGGGALLMSIFFGENPSPTAFGFGEAIVTYFVPLAMVIGGSILLSRK